MATKGVHMDAGLSKAPMVDDMQRKFGPTYPDMLDVWVERYAFRSGGGESPSMKIRIQADNRKRLLHLPMCCTCHAWLHRSGSN